MDTMKSEIIEKLVKVNNLNNDILITDIDDLIMLFEELKICFFGTDMDAIFKEILDQNGNLKRISQVVESYSDCLLGIMEAYKLQDQKFKISLDQMNI